MENDKRQKAIFGSIFLVTGVVILIAISALVVGSILDSSVFQDTVTSGTNTNETLTNVTNITTVNFAILSTLPDATCTLTQVLNSTGTVITSGNYTQPTSCQILATSSSNYIGDNWNVTYSFTDTQSNTAGLNVTELTDGFSAFVLGIVTFLGIIGIIIGIVWLISYLKPLFSKDDGIQSFAGN